MKFYEKVISDFGGYEKCKDILSQPNIGFIMNVQALRKHMLEYRRQHNIFEVGDLIVLPYTNYRSDTFELTEIFKKSCDDKGIAYRHATDGEIKVGHRL